MALPKATQKQAAEAEELHRQIYSVETKPAEKQAADDEAVGASAEENDTKAEEPRQTETKADKPEDGSTWEQRYKVLQGKYNAEVPRLQRQNNQQAAQLEALQAQLDSLQKSLLEKKETAAPPKGESLLKPDEIEDYGEDMIDVVKRAAREELLPYIQQLEQRNGQLESLLGGMQQQTLMSARDKMLSELDNDPEVSHWREINSDPAFLAWLENVDPFSGQRRLEMLRQAFDKNQTQRVRVFFKSYLDENAAFTPGREKPQPKTTVGMESLVAPGTATGGDTARAQQDDAPGKVWTEADVAKFYRDVQKGVYRDNPQERARVERDIFAAQEQGRIR